PSLSGSSSTGGSRSLSFLSCGSGALLRLHSFPTRRSSDLSSFSLAAAAAADSADSAPARASIPWSQIGAEAGTDYKGDGGSCGRDRKSTRLNSSHVKISYAVFCLKKKKKRHAVRDTARAPC